MSKHEEGELILKLYELRRDPLLRQARDWYFFDFFPETINDYQAALLSENSAHLRMVTSYWDMAAALVNHGAISRDFFNDTNGECIPVFARVEPLLGEIRARFGEQYMVNLERLIDGTPGGRERVAKVREGAKGMRAQIAEMRARAAAK